MGAFDLLIIFFIPEKTIPKERLGKRIYKLNI
jgi:hypothetical protein